MATHQLTNIARALPATAIVLFIFFMSAAEGPASTSLSFGLSQIIADSLNYLLGTSISPYDIHYGVRKTAHITEFFLLTLSIWLAIAPYIRGKARAMGITALATVLIAALDEIHQTFVADRDGRVTDVLIDSIGVALAIACIAAWHFGRAKR